jgi:hypothetical protein
LQSRQIHNGFSCDNKRNKHRLKYSVQKKKNLRTVEFPWFLTGNILHLEE